MSIPWGGGRHLIKHNLDPGETYPVVVLGVRRTLALLLKQASAHSPNQGAQVLRFLAFVALGATGSAGGGIECLQLCSNERNSAGRRPHRRRINIARAASCQDGRGVAQPESCLAGERAAQISVADLLCDVHFCAHSRDRCCCSWCCWYTVEAGEHGRRLLLRGAGCGDSERAGEFDAGKYSTLSLEGKRAALVLGVSMTLAGGDPECRATKRELYSALSRVSPLKDRDPFFSAGLIRRCISYGTAHGSTQNVLRVLRQTIALLYSVVAIVDPPGVVALGGQPQPHKRLTRRIQVPTCRFHSFFWRRADPAAIASSRSTALFFLIRWFSGLHCSFTTNNTLFAIPVHALVLSSVATSWPAKGNTRPRYY